MSISGMQNYTTENAFINNDHNPISSVYIAEKSAIFRADLRWGLSRFTSDHFFAKKHISHVTINNICNQT